MGFEGITCHLWQRPRIGEIILAPNVEIVIPPLMSKQWKMRNWSAHMGCFVSRNRNILCSNTQLYIKTWFDFFYSFISGVLVLVSHFLSSFFCFFFPLSFSGSNVKNKIIWQPSHDPIMSPSPQFGTGWKERVKRRKKKRKKLDWEINFLMQISSPRNARLLFFFVWTQKRWLSLLVRRVWSFWAQTKSDSVYDFW